MKNGLICETIKGTKESSLKVNSDNDLSNVIETTKNIRFLIYCIIAFHFYLNINYIM